MHRYNLDPYADKPTITMANIDDPDYEESWADGLIMFHNPNVLAKVDPALLPDISHMFFDKEKISVLWAFSAFTSIYFCYPGNDSCCRSGVHRRGNDQNGHVGDQHIKFR